MLTKVELTHLLKNKILKENPHRIEDFADGDQRDFYFIDKGGNSYSFYSQKIDELESNKLKQFIHNYNYNSLHFDYHSKVRNRLNLCLQGETNEEKCFFEIYNHELQKLYSLTEDDKYPELNFETLFESLILTYKSNLNEILKIDLKTSKFIIDYKLLPLDKKTEFNEPLEVTFNKIYSHFKLKYLVDNFQNKDFKSVKEISKELNNKSTKKLNEIKISINCSTSEFVDLFKILQKRGWISLPKSGEGTARLILNFMEFESNKPTIKSLGKSFAADKYGLGVNKIIELEKIPSLLKIQNTTQIRQ